METSSSVRKAPVFDPVVLARYTTDLQPPYHCNVVEGHCGKEFTNPAGLVTHVNRAHLKTVNPNTRKRHNRRKCPHCELKFKPAGMTRHLRETHGITKEGSQPNGANGHRGGPVALLSPVHEVQIDPVRKVAFCPVCGTSVKLVQAAIDFAGQ